MGFGFVLDDTENLTVTGVRTPDRPAHIESPYRLRYPGRPRFENGNFCKDLSRKPRRQKYLAVCTKARYVLLLPVTLNGDKSALFD